MVPSSLRLRTTALAAGVDAHAVGRRLATEVLAELGDTLAYDGTRPVAARMAVSIAHSKTCVVAIAGPVARLGIDVVDERDRARCARIAPRFLLATDHAAERFAATEAALKALGLGLLDGGVFDAPLTISLAPPRVTIAGETLALVLGHLGDSIVAIAYAP